MGTQKQEFVDKGAADVAAGASLREPVDWHSINWRKAHRNVRRLQARIVKALKAGQKRKVRALPLTTARPTWSKRNGLLSYWPTWTA